MAIPLIGNGLFSAAVLFSGAIDAIVLFGAAFGVWMVIVGHLLLLTYRLGHYLAIPTYGWLALNSAVGVVYGIASKAALIWIAICLVAILYCVLALWRTRPAHAI